MQRQSDPNPSDTGLELATFGHSSEDYDIEAENTGLLRGTPTEKSRTCRADSDDSTDHHVNHNGASVSRTVVNTFISFIGAGILGLPYAFRQVGVVSGSVCMIAIASLATYCMLLLVESKETYAKTAPQEEVTKLGYSELGALAFGRPGRVTMDILLVTTQTAFAVAYLIFIPTNLHAIAPSISKSAVVLIGLPGLALLSQIRHLKHLAYSSLVADVCNLVGLLTIFSQDAKALASSSPAPERREASISLLPYFAGVAIYCFEGVGMILPIENSMQDRKKFVPVLLGTIASVTSIYILFGVLGYLAFGDETQEIVTLNMHSEVANFVKVSLCLALYCTYPLMLHPVNEILERVLLGTTQPQGRAFAVSRFLRVGIVLMTAAAATLIPDFGDFLSLIGSSCCSLLAFIIPAAIHLRMHPDLCRRRVLVDWAIILSGAVMMVLGTFDAAMDMLHHYHDHGEEGGGGHGGGGGSGGQDL